MVNKGQPVGAVGLVGNLIGYSNDLAGQNGEAPLTKAFDFGAMVPKDASPDAAFAKSQLRCGKYSLSTASALAHDSKDDSENGQKECKGGAPTEVDDEKDLGVRASSPDENGPEVSLVVSTEGSSSLNPDEVQVTVEARVSKNHVMFLPLGFARSDATRRHTSYRRLATVRDNIITPANA